MGLGAKRLKFYFSFTLPPPAQFMDRVVNMSRGIYCTNCTYLSNQILVKVAQDDFSGRMGLGVKRLKFFSVQSPPPCAIYGQGCKHEQGYILYKLYLIITSDTCKSDFKVTSLGGWA